MKWVHQYVPEIDKKVRPHLKRTNKSWRVDETYIKVKGKWTYLYLGVDKEGSTLVFVLRAKRDAKAATRFFKKTLGANHTEVPRVINVYKNPALASAINNLKDNFCATAYVSVDKISSRVTIWSKYSVSKRLLSGPFRLISAFSRLYP